MSETLPPWVARIREAPVTVGLTVIDVTVFLIAEMHGRTTEASTLVRFGAVESHLVWAGQYWRLAAYMFLHIGWLHLLWNAYASFGWCTRVERELGHLRFLVVYLLAGVAGGAASTVLAYPISAGASGAMFGMVGATLALRRRALPSFAAARADPPTRAMLANIAIWIVVGVTAMPMNNRAHLGGLVAGAVATWIFTAARRAPLWIAYGMAFFTLLVFATRPWSRHVSYATPVEALDAGPSAPADAGRAARCEPSRARLAEVTPPFFQRVTVRLVAGASVHTRMGSFELVVLPGYEGRNPRTGAVVPVAAKRNLRFVASEELATRALGRHALPPRGTDDATLPSVEVACGDAELDAVARALVDCEDVEVPGLGTLSARELADEGPLVVLDPSPAALNALNAR